MILETRNGRFDMSNYIEQAFTFSVGDIQKHSIQQHGTSKIKEPNTPPSDGERGSVDHAPYDRQLSADLDLFDNVKLDVSEFSNQTAPWEELDIDIEPCFKSSLSPYLF
jgi:hypothetical protein